MNKKIEIKPIGSVKAENNAFSIHIDKEFLPGLASLEGFSHLQILWWGHLFDDNTYRSNLVNKKPYKKGPEKVGVFATHSPIRPNPVLLTTVFVQHIDYENGIIYTPYIDAEAGTPVLDIKPYHLEERVKDCMVPGWCSHWPEWYEDSATFNWQNEFNF